jgi:predicted nucleotidyltransferase
MQNAQAKWRVVFGRHLAEKLIAFKGIRAIVIAGSVARDYADEYSDVEIPIYWETLPEDTTRHEIVSALHAEFLYAYNGPSYEDQLLIKNFQVDLWHITMRQQEATLAAVLRDHQIDLSSLNALDTIRCCIPLYGLEIVQNWKRQAREYPNELAERIIQEHLPSFHIGGLFLQAQRDNPTTFYAQLSFLQQEIYVVLLALNRSYFPSFKWLYPSLESIRIKPKAIGRRFRKAYESPQEEAIADTKLILEETLRLVEEQFPQMNLAPIHRHLAYVRAAHKRPINF